MSKHTPWFPGSVKPVRKGVYQREYTYGKTPNVQYCYWNGKAWAMGEHTVERAEWNRNAFILAPNQSLPWRGVLK